MFQLAVALAVLLASVSAGGQPAAQTPGAVKPVPSTTTMPGRHAETPVGGGDDAVQMPFSGRSFSHEPLRLLFIHHSCGGQLMADQGPVKGGADRASGEYCIHESHPNGGGLRTLLEAEGYEVHEASYGSRVGEDTDIHHWRRKFTNQMDEILTCDRQDKFYTDGRRNHIVAFKSCYPNNAFRGPGSEPGDPDARELTVANAKAAYRSLLPIFEKHPDVLFVAFTAPPLAEPRAAGMKAKMKEMFKGKSKAGELAREFNAWLTDRENGWLAKYPLRNVAVFDYYGTLSAGNPGGWSAHATQGGRDSHPSSDGNRKAAEAFVPFLNQAVAEMGLRRHVALDAPHQMSAPVGGAVQAESATRPR